MSARSKRFLLHQEVACLVSEKAGGSLILFYSFGFFAPFTALVNIFRRYTAFELTYRIFSYLVGEKLCIVNQRKQFVNLRFEVL